MAERLNPRIATATALVSLTTCVWIFASVFHLAVENLDFSADETETESLGLAEDESSSSSWTWPASFSKG